MNKNMLFFSFFHFCVNRLVFSLPAFYLAAYFLFNLSYSLPASAQVSVSPDAALDSVESANELLGSIFTDVATNEVLVPTTQVKIFGHGEEIVNPDVATIKASFQETSSQDNLEEKIKIMNDTISNAIKIAKSHGVSDENIYPAVVEVKPFYDRNEISIENANYNYYYNCHYNDNYIILSNLTMVMKLSTSYRQLLVAFSSLPISSIENSLHLSDSTGYYNTALSKAVIDALEKANTISEASNLLTIGIKRLEEVSRDDFYTENNPVEYEKQGSGKTSISPPTIKASVIVEMELGVIEIREEKQKLIPFLNGD